MKANNHISEHYLYWLAFAIALVLRFFQLGAAPLADAEANWALQALGLANSGVTTIGAQPAYVLLTSILFSLFGKTNFIARFLPALLGSLVVWLPFYFRRWMGDSSWLHRAGLVLAFGLAIDPGLVSLSRQAGSSIPALVFTLLALAAVYNRHMVWTGIFTALALLSGPSFLQGLLILAISWGLFRLAVGKMEGAPQGMDEAEPGEASIQPPAVRKAIPAFILTILVAGTLLLRVPQGLGGLADTLPAYLKLWITPSGVPVLRLPGSLLVYELLVVIFFLIDLARIWFGKNEAHGIHTVMLGLSVWAVVALVLPLVYAGRQVGDMSWALVLLWALAALEIGRLLEPADEKTTRVVAACLCALLFILAVVGWMNLLSISHDPSRLALYLAIIVGAFLLGLIGSLLVAAGWSAAAARLGVITALCLVFGLQLTSNTIGMAFVRQNGALELWSPDSTTDQAGLVMATLADLSVWNTGLRDQLEIVALDASPSLKWALRNFPNARFESALASTEAPAVVITQKGAEEPVLAQKYRGQDFVWSLSAGWQGAFPPDFINWLAFRAAPLSQAQVILWARADIFPGGAPQGPGVTTP